MIVFVLGACNNASGPENRRVISSDAKDSSGANLIIGAVGGGSQLVVQFYLPFHHRVHLLLEL